MLSSVKNFKILSKPNGYAFNSINFSEHQKNFNHKSGYDKSF